jgi:uncharacterized membrane protein YphA (DoxX/SURF4 family)
MKTPAVTSILLLLFLRLAVGSHFFSEGLTKLRAKGFSAEPFLRAATGPAAPLLQRLLDDPDHARLLCIQREAGPGGAERVKTDPELTIALWNDFADRCVAHYRFGDPAFASTSGQPPAQTAAQVQDITRQADDARKLVASHVEQLNAWLEANRTGLIAHFSTAEREAAFERDGAAGPQVASQVASLRDQTARIRQERKQLADGWAAEVNALWDSLETALPALATPEQAAAAGQLALHRPHDQPDSWLKWINRVVPWFDLAVGVLLLLGLFSRWAAMAGALLLVAVIATQPPWVPAAAPVWYQLVELAALLVLASSLARAIPGLDWLVPLKGVPRQAVSRPARAA